MAAAGAREGDTFEDAQEHDPQPRSSGGLKLSFRKEDMPQKSDFQDFQIMSLGKWPLLIWKINNKLGSKVFVPMDSLHP
jgi:hypothetical protein